jgi:crotonobetainyl-CoA:carnitine CoA-transferase CaiB-like acyl-CoA transferase
LQGVLNGIRVLDFGRFIAGPYCGMLLADFGAEVIRVDKIGGSEDRYILPLAESGEGGMFMQINRNKRDITLNPSVPEGREILEKLVANTDVVIANLPWEVLPALGIDYDSLKAIKPDIILATMSTFGREGPYKDRVGFDGIAQAMSGNMHMTGTEDEKYKSMAPYCDFGTALSAAFGIMVALRHRDQTGEGQVVEGTLMRTAVTMTNSYLIEQAITAPNREPTGNLGQTAGPADLYKAKDGQVLVQVVSNNLFRRWARLMDDPDQWINDPRFKDDISRGDNGHILSEAMSAWCAERTVEECLEALESVRIPAGPVLSGQQVLDDAHVNETNMLQYMSFPTLPKDAPIMGPPVELTASPGEIRHRAPTVGEHTEDVLAELGYDAQAIAAMQEKGAV